MIKYSFFFVSLQIFKKTMQFYVKNFLEYKSKKRHLIYSKSFATILFVSGDGFMINEYLDLAPQGKYTGYRYTYELQRKIFSSGNLFLARERFRVRFYKNIDICFQNFLALVPQF